MNHLLLLGDEAIAQAAIDAGMSGIYAYPGTPSTEITEYVQASPQARQKHIRSDWSANEKTAMEAALGMSYAGKRTMVCMKHVGLNVAADAFVNSAITGVNGGLIITVADDPSMHSSQNEQDSRFFGKFAMVPVFEPSNQQEAYNMVFDAFELSEKLAVPVLMRITTRLAHSRSSITQKPSLEQNEASLPKDSKQYILLPAIARKRYHSLLGKQDEMEKAAATSPYNEYYDGKDKTLGIITCGLAYNYLMENFVSEKPANPVLKICQYPIPRAFVNKIYNECERILVIEEGYPFLEEQLRGFLDNGKEILGRMDRVLPREGELNPDLVLQALTGESKSTFQTPELMVNRPPALCKGCGHVDVYHALNEAIEEYGKGRVFSDIGCYTLGALPPFDSINSCVDMGASITMAKGAADAGLDPSVCVIGDSTFTHSGMTGLLDAVLENTPMTVIISDNSTTGMTGGQKSSATGRLEQICEGIGVDPAHIRTFVPLKKNHDDNVQVLKEEFLYKGVSVVIARRECIQTAARRKKQEKKLKELENQ
ncbi:MAG: thiamine pyrophosphate-dependent enzyme [Bacteroidota bacterium]